MNLRVGIKEVVIMLLLTLSIVLFLRDRSARSSIRQMEIEAARMGEQHLRDSLKVDGLQQLASKSMQAAHDAQMAADSIAQRSNATRIIERTSRSVRDLSVDSMRSILLHRPE